MERRVHGGLVGIRLEELLGWTSGYRYDAKLPKYNGWENLSEPFAFTQGLPKPRKPAFRNDSASIPSIQSHTYIQTEI